MTTTFANIEIGRRFSMNGTTWTKRSDHTAHIAGCPGTWFFFSTRNRVQSA